MKDYIQQLIELFGHNNYSADTHKKVQQWLADEEHVDEKSEALRELWKQAGEQKVPDGMQQSIQRMRQNLGMQSITSRRNYQLLIWRAAAILLLAVSSVSIYPKIPNCAHAMPTTAVPIINHRTLISFFIKE